MEQFRLIVEIAGGVAALIALFAPMYKSVKKQMKKVELVQDALMGLLHDRICRLCESYLRKGYATNEEREQLQVLFTPYKAMGGNHNAATLYEKVMEELPLEKQKDMR